VRGVQVRVETESHFTGLPRRVNVSLVERNYRQTDSMFRVRLPFIKVKKSCYSANLDEETVALQTDNRVGRVDIES
jgi:hypothetical protein